MTTTAPSQDAATPTTIHTTGHVGLNVTDVTRSAAFYADVLGLEVQASAEDAERRFAFLSGGGRLVLTLWQQSDTAFSAAQAGLHHLSFEVPSMDEVNRVEALLRARGVAIEHDGIVAHGEGASSGGVFFRDPDGIRLEVYAPSGAEAAPAPTGAAPTCGFF